MFNKILVPVDGSEHSDKALHYATVVAEKFNSEIILLHVFSTPMSVPIDPMIGATSITPEIMDAVHKAEEQILKKAQAKVAETKKSEKKVSVTAYLKEGNIVDEIVSTAKKEKVDLIVIGARGLSKLKEVFLGSVSEGVTHHTHCPVMIIK